MIKENTKTHVIALGNGSLVLLEKRAQGARKSISMPDSVTAPTSKGQQALYKPGVEFLGCAYASQESWSKLARVSVTCCRGMTKDVSRKENQRDGE